ncbi:MAG: Ig-like domain-containing protein [Acidobacteriota bacterium]
MRSPRGARCAGAALLVVSLVVDGGVQTALPAVTVIDAILAYPAFFHLRQVVVLGEFSVSGDDYRLAGPGGSRIVVVGADASRLPAGLVEVRGDVVDLGRMDPKDPRLAPLKLDRIVAREGHTPWPRPRELTVMLPRTATRWQRVDRPALRDVALAPEIYEGQRVTVVGAFRGRNLYGEVPAAPGRVRVEYLLRSRDAALWVIGLPPRGSGFELDLSSRRDTGRIVEVSGIVRRDGGLAWIEGQTIGLTKDQLEPDPPPPPPAPVGPPPDVLFSVPTPGEVDVPVGTSVRVQFSQSMASETFEGRVRVGYLTPPDAPFASVPDSPAFFVAYEPKDRLLTIRFAEPLERFHIVRVDLVAGIRSADGRALEPWTLTFRTGDRRLATGDRTGDRRLATGDREGDGRLARGDGRRGTSTTSPWSRVRGPCPNSRSETPPASRPGHSPSWP